MDLLTASLPRGRADGQVQSSASVQLRDIGLLVSSGEQLSGLRWVQSRYALLSCETLTTLTPVFCKREADETQHVK
jgi:hypothetical protein